MRSFVLPITSVLTALLLPAASWAQDATVTGRVTTQALVPIVGASVTIPRLQLSARTNDAGVYRIVVPADRMAAGRDTVLVNRIGYRPRAVAFDLAPGEVRVDVALPEAAVALEEIVVTGTAGNQERRAQAATVATIDASSIVQTAPISNVQQLIAGRVPGVLVTQTTGSSGGTSLIRIRGVSSISLSNEPLVFIDGVKMDNRSIGDFGSIYFGNSISTLNSLQPDDIESIEVVKGPAAATLYGADASAGVIQIITKRGRPGSGGFSQSITAEYAQIQPNFTPPSNFAACTAALVEPTSVNPLCQGQPVGTIVQDNPMVREGVLDDGNAKSISWSGRGGGTNYGYFLSYGYDNEVGTLPQNGFTRQTARANFNFVPSSKLAIDAGFGLSRDVNDQANVADNLHGVMTSLLGSPLSRGTATNGWFAANRDGAALSQIVNRFNIIRFTPNVTARYTPFEWFSNRLTFGTDLARIQAHQFFPRNARGSYGGTKDNGELVEFRQNVDNWTLDYLGNARQTYGATDEWAVDVSLGAQIIAGRDDVVSALGQGFVTNSNNAVSSATTITAGGGSNEQRSVGFIGQVQTGWRDRLFLQVGARVDQNSAFGDASERFFLPKAGLSYVLSDESFWQNQLPFIGTLRLRAAYGTTGRSPQPGASLTTFSSAPYVLLPGVTAAGVLASNPGNDSLVAERGTELEAGVDAGFWNDRVGLEVTYFDKVTKDLILRRPIPPSLGFGSNPFANIGEVLNRGVEITLRGQIVTLPNFAWESRASVATLDNELRSLGGLAPFQLSGVAGAANSYREGDPLGAWYGRKIISVDAAANQAIVTDTAVYLGSPIPTYSGNFSTDLTFFRNLRLTGLLEFSGGNKKLHMNEFFRERAFTSSERFQKQADLPAEERTRLFGPYATASGAPVSASLVSEDYLQDASFVRLREASATYALPARVTGMIGGSNASITIGGRNLGLWTDYRGGDPESISYVPTNGQLLALDFLTMPQTRRYFARLNLGF